MRATSRLSARRRSFLVALLVGSAVPMSAAAAGLTVTSQHLTTTATCALVSYPATAIESIDSFVDQKAPTSTTGGTNKNLAVQSQSGANRRAYVEFDLAACLFAPPASAVVRSATLRLDESGPLPTTCRTYDVFRNTSGPWTESTLNWNNQPAGTTTNQPPTAQRTSSQNVGSPTTCANHTATAYVSWDVTADVAAFLAGTATNYGWMIRDDAENNSTAIKIAFSARETNTLALAPQLLITYTLV